MTALPFFCSFRCGLQKASGRTRTKIGRWGHALGQPPKDPSSGERRRVAPDSQEKQG